MARRCDASLPLAMPHLSLSPPPYAQCSLLAPSPTFALQTSLNPSTSTSSSSSSRIDSTLSPSQSALTSMPYVSPSKVLTSHRPLPTTSPTSLKQTMQSVPSVNLLSMSSPSLSPTSPVGTSKRSIAPSSPIVDQLQKDRSESRSSSLPPPSRPRPLRRRTQEVADIPSIAALYPALFPTDLGSENARVNSSSSKGKTLKRPPVRAWSGSTSGYAPLPTPSSSNTSIDDLVVAGCNLDTPPRLSTPMYALNPATDHPLSEAEMRDLLERLERDLAGVDPEGLRGPFRQLALSRAAKNENSTGHGNPIDHSKPFPAISDNLVKPNCKETSKGPLTPKGKSLTLAQHHATFSSPARSNPGALEDDVSNLARTTVSPKEAFVDFEDVSHRLEDAKALRRAAAQHQHQQQHNDLQSPKLASPMQSLFSVNTTSPSNVSAGNGGTAGSPLNSGRAMSPGFANVSASYRRPSPIVLSPGLASVAPEDGHLQDRQIVVKLPPAQVPKNAVRVGAGSVLSPGRASVSPEDGGKIVVKLPPAQVPKNAVRVGAGSGFERRHRKVMSPLNPEMSTVGSSSKSNMESNNVTADQSSDDDVFEKSAEPDPGKGVATTRSSNSTNLTPDMTQSRADYERVVEEDELDEIDDDDDDDDDDNSKPYFWEDQQRHESGKSLPLTTCGVANLESGGVATSSTTSTPRGTQTSSPLPSQAPQSSYKRMVSSDHDDVMDKMERDDQDVAGDGEENVALVRQGDVLNMNSPLTNVVSPSSMLTRRRQSALSGPSHHNTSTNLGSPVSLVTTTRKRKQLASEDVSQIPSRDAGGCGHDENVEHVGIPRHDSVDIAVTPSTSLDEQMQTQTHGVSSTKATTMAVTADSRKKRQRTESPGTKGSNFPVKPSTTTLQPHSPLVPSHLSSTNQITNLSGSSNSSSHKTHAAVGHPKSSSSASASAPAPTSITAGGLSLPTGQIQCDWIDPISQQPCQVIFRRPYDLARHKETIHSLGGKKMHWVCQECHGEFSRKDALYRHCRIKNHKSGLA